MWGAQCCALVWSAARAARADRWLWALPCQKATRGKASSFLACRYTGQPSSHLQLGLAEGEIMATLMQVCLKLLCGCHCRHIRGSQAGISVPPAVCVKEGIEPAPRAQPGAEMPHKVPASSHCLRDT